MSWKEVVIWQHCPSYAPKVCHSRRLCFVLCGGCRNLAKFLYSTLKVISYKSTTTCPRTCSQYCHKHDTRKGDHITISVQTSQGHPHPVLKKKRSHVQSCSCIRKRLLSAPYLFTCRSTSMFWALQLKKWLQGKVKVCRRLRVNPKLFSPAFTGK